MNTETQKRGKGRPAGETFSGITLAELSKRYKPDQVIPVGRLFIERGVSKTKSQMFVAHGQATPITPTAAPKQAEELPKVEMQLAD